VSSDNNVQYTSYGRLSVATAAQAGLLPDHCSVICVCPQSVQFVLHSASQGVVCLHHVRLFRRRS